MGPRLIYQNEYFLQAGFFPSRWGGNLEHTCFFPQKKANNQVMEICLENQIKQNKILQCFNNLESTYTTGNCFLFFVTKAGKTSDDVIFVLLLLYYIHSAQKCSC